MANAKKCDRCGKYYMERKRIINEETGSFITDHPQYIRYGECGSIAYDASFDICYDCLDSFMGWLNEYHNKGEYIKE